MRPNEAVELADYRRRVHEMYARVRVAGGGVAAWRAWRAERDRLFRSHPQSAIDTVARSSFTGLSYFDYDVGLRLQVDVEPVDHDPLDIEHSGPGATPFVPVGLVSLHDIGIAETLTVYWLQAYGGGLFLPFRDATAGNETYGGGRYMLDTVKGADLGMGPEGMVLDFNYAYHPSCVYSPRWSCPLAPTANRLTASIRGGERLGRPASPQQIP